LIALISSLLTHAQRRHQTMSIVDAVISERDQLY
jgi:hypothetical protein